MAGYNQDNNTGLCYGKLWVLNRVLKHYSSIPDIDECSEGLDMCASNATCTNTEGDYNCSCDTGYNGDGFTCDSKRRDYHRMYV